MIDEGETDISNIRSNVACTKLTESEAPFCPDIVRVFVGEHNLTALLYIPHIVRTALRLP